MSKTSKIRRNRNRKGAAVLELALSLPFLIAVCILSINLAVMMLGADIGDGTCKDCARAAGQMPTPDEAVNAMNAVAKGHPIDGVIIQSMSPELLVYRDYNNSSKPTPVYGTTKAYLAENGPNNIQPITNRSNDEVIGGSSKEISISSPYVVVRVTVTIKMPIRITLLGCKLFSGNVADHPDLYQFQSIYNYPITNTYEVAPN